jgi:predicted unusual protein kinase regulating ubiquinone biosynthesis (AarF/ABC1/UbiB family)
MSLQTSRLRRTAAVAGLPVRAVGRSVRLRAAAAGGADQDGLQNAARAETAADVREVLGTLKGGAMKVGQLLSTVDALLPQDPDGSWQQAVTALQESSPGLPFDQIEPVLVADLGAGWRRRFHDFDEAPVAAASIGQVHRATWAADGRLVAVKIQYPGVAEAMAADVASLAAALRVMSVIMPGTALPPLIGELRVRLAEELDYGREGAHQRRFAREYRGDSEVSVPDILLAHRRILVSEWLPGTGFASISLDGSRAERDRAGLLYQRFFLTSPGRVGLLHTDPHPGNFRLLPDGRLGVLDFGSVLVLPGGLPPTFGGLIGGMLAGDPKAVEERLRSDGFLRPGKRIEIEKLVDYLAPFTEPASREVFHYSRGWLREQFARANDPRNPDFTVALRLTMPAEQLFTHRVWLGLVGVLSGLDAEVPVRAELLAHLPGFAEAVGLPA